MWDREEREQGKSGEEGTERVAKMGNWECIVRRCGNGQERE